MKFEIDLNDILGDEYGAETLEQSIRRQVVDNITEFVQKGAKSKINEEVNIAINKAIQDTLEEHMPSIIDDIINVEFTPIDRYGSKSEPTSFRAQLIKSIHETMTYKNCNYASDKNVFTKAVDEVINEQMKIIQSEYKKTVDDTIGKKAFELAISTLKTKLGLT